MLGTEPEVIKNYVETGKVRIVFWPVLNHGNPSLYSTLTAECVAQQDPALFWVVHGVLFENYSDLWSADRDYFVKTAGGVGADQAEFEACYDGGTALEHVMALDNMRRERGIFSQPIFDINGQIYAGAPPYEVFAAALDSVLAAVAP